VAFVKQHDSRSWYRFVVAAVTAGCILLLLGCRQSEIRGTYDVEIEIARAVAGIEGTLVLSAGVLDVPALTNEERADGGSDWFESDTIDANSCFVLHGGSTAEQTPQSVRIFEARLRGSEIVLPIEIYRSPVQSIEIVSLQFFADTIGGDVVLHDGGRELTGQIHGVRSGAPSAQKCLDELELFRAMLREPIAQ
jgi:hypothetical protein